MKAPLVVSILLSLSGIGAVAEEKNPLGTALDLLATLEAKIVKEGETEEVQYKEFFAWCDGQSSNLGNDIKTETRHKDKAEAKIAQLTSDIEVSKTKIEELAAAISAHDGELKDAAAIRSKEAANFETAETELTDGIETIGNAIASLDSKGAAALAQIDSSSMEKMVQSISTAMDAAGFETKDHATLVAMLQGEDGDDTLESGAPAAATYESHSDGIIDLLQDMKDKAEGELADARKAEGSARHNYNIMRQSLQNQVEADTKDLEEEKTAKARFQEERATVQGDLTSTTAELKDTQKRLGTVQQDCMTAANDHEATVEARNEELKVIAEGVKILKESTGGAESQSYSLLQIAARSRIRTHSDLASAEVVATLKKLAKDHHSTVLSQLASRVSVTLKFGSKGGEDPFEKVRGLLNDMIVRLESEAASDATEKAYCDEEMAKTESKKSDLDDTTNKVVSQIDKAAARSASLKEEVAELQSELGALSKSQAEMDRMRQTEHAEYENATEELHEGLSGVRKALDVLRDYYGNSGAMVQIAQEDETDDAKFAAMMQQPAAPQKHEKATGAGGSIIGLLEVVESDFATNLAKEEAEESDAATDYEKTTQENEVDKASKESDVKYKTSEAASLDKQISQLSIDKANVLNEAAAVNTYYEKLKERCVAKPESHEERAARRNEEIAGLQDALAALNEQTSFVQERSLRRRGGTPGFLST